MPSERLQRQIDRLLDEAEAAARSGDWETVRARADAVLAYDPENTDAKLQLDAAERRLSAPRPAVEKPADPTGTGGVRAAAPVQPTTFANGRYTVKKFLGEGGKKKVFLAHDNTLDRDVAFALIKTEGLDEISRQRVTREAQAMGRLGDHPNIVPIFDLGIEPSPRSDRGEGGRRPGEGQPYMVLPLMSGGDVEGLIEKATAGRPERADGSPGKAGSGSQKAAAPRGLPLDRVLQIAIDTCNGLVFAHSKGIVHRDLKPGNVWLTAEGTARIGDFGLAVATDRSRLTREGFMVGTVGYMPPEQAMGGEITPKADLYSLGAMLYEMVTGRRPFLGDDDIAIIGQHINTPPVAPGWHRADCPKPLDALIMRLLAKDPAQRPESAADVLSALKAINPSPRSNRGEGGGTPGEGDKVGRSLDSMSSGVFVGRQREMDQLKAALEDTLSGRGRMIALVGEPGIGKTRTAFELATYAGLRSCQVIWGRCYEGAGAPPYWPWVQAIRQYVQEHEPDQIRKEMGSTASVIAEIVADIKDRIPEVKSPPQVDNPEAARFRLFDSVSTFLKNAARIRPIVLILDDLHWSDKPSLMLLEFVARELGGSRVLLVGTYRDVDLSRRHPLALTLGDLMRERLFERVVLRGLTREDVGNFVNLAAGVVPPANLVDTVYRHTEGNPLFVTETVRLLVQEGELSARRLESRGRGTTSWEIRIPEGVREVIGRRLDRLSEQCNELMTTAAVVGRQFRLELLKQMFGPSSGVERPLTENRLLDLLDEALASRIIEEVTSEIGLYQFTHALLQETLTAELSLTRRVRVHARIATALEGIYGADANAHAAELAQHFEQAQTILGPDKLVSYSLVAGWQALSAYGFEEAVDHFQRGLQAGKDTITAEQRARFLLGLGQASLHTLERFELQRALDLLIEAFDIFAGLGDTRSAVDAAATVFPNARGSSGRVKLIERALPLATPSSRDHAQLLAALAMAVSIELDDEVKASEVAAEAAQLAQKIGEPGIEMRALLAPNAFPESDEDEQVLNSRVRGLLRRVTDPHSECIFLEKLGHGRVLRGQFRQANEAYQEGLAAAERSKNRWLRAVLHADIANVAVREGDLRSASEHLEKGLIFSPMEPRLLWQVGRVAFDTGNAAGASECLARAREDSHPMAWGIALAFGSKITGRDLTTPEEFEVLRSLFEARDRRREARAGLAVASVLLIRNDRDALSRMMPRLLEVWGDSTPLPNTVALVPSALPELAAAAGDFSAAERRFAVLDGSKHLGLLDRAWLYFDWSESLIARGLEADHPRALKMQDQALKIARDLGMKPLTERILARKKILKA